MFNLLIDLFQFFLWGYFLFGQTNVCVKQSFSLDVFKSKEEITHKKTFSTQSIAVVLHFSVAQLLGSDFVLWPHRRTQTDRQTNKHSQKSFSLFGDK